MPPTTITLSGIAGHGLGGSGTTDAPGLIAGIPGSERVRAAVEELTGHVLSFLLPGDTYAALELMRRVEEDFRTATRKLETMHRAGAASAKDYDSYDTLRRNVYQVEKTLSTKVRASVARLAGADAASRVPTPALAPAITAASPLSGRRNGFGELGTAVLVVGAILVLLVALGLVAYFVSEALDERAQRDVAVVAEQALALKEMYGLRANYVAECVAGGSDPSSCAANATELYPTPAEAGLVIPEQGAGWGWVPWAVGALGVTIVAVLGYRVYSKERGQFRGFAGSAMPVRASSARGRPARRALTASTRGRYGLEVR